MVTVTQTIAERFWTKVKLPDSGIGCMYWTASVKPGGYGQFSIAQRPQLAHRVAWTLANGPIPAEMVVDHECHNRDRSCTGGTGCPHRRCCNPSHLALKTSQANVEASHSSNGNRTHCPQGHPYNLSNTYVNGRGHRFCRTCARERRAAY